MALSSKEKIREIYKALPKLNCGLCGYGNCGQFVRVVAEGRALPFVCRQNPWSGYRVSEIVRMKVPAYSYAFQTASTPSLEITPLPEALKTLREETEGLSQKMDDILAKIEKLKARR